MRRALLTVALVSMCTVIAVGCSGPRETIFTGSYWKRVGSKICDDFHQFRVDFDRIVWDLDERPLTDY